MFYAKFHRNWLKKNCQKKYVTIYLIFAYAFNLVNHLFTWLNITILKGNRVYSISTSLVQLRVKSGGHQQATSHILLQGGANAPPWLRQGGAFSIQGGAL